MGRPIPYKMDSSVFVNVGLRRASAANAVNNDIAQKLCHSERSEESPHQFYCQSIITCGDASAKPQHDTDFSFFVLCFSGNIVTNGTGRPVPYCADCTLFVNVGNGLDRSVTNAKSTT